MTTSEHGLDEPVAVNGTTLSGGQRQRLGLARALAADPAGAGAARPDHRRRRGHRAADRGRAARRTPRRRCAADDAGADQQPGAARPGRPGGPPPGRAGGRQRHARGAAGGRRLPRRRCCDEGRHPAPGLDGAPRPLRLARTLLRPTAAGRSPSACVMFAIEGLAGLVAPWMLGRIVDVVDDRRRPRGRRWSRSPGSSAPRWSAAWRRRCRSACWRGSPSRRWPTSASRCSTARSTSTAAELEAAGSGDLLSRVGDDVRLVGGLVHRGHPDCCSAPSIAVVFTAGGLFALDWRLGLAGLGGGAVLYVLGPAVVPAALGPLLPPRARGQRRACRGAADRRARAAAPCARTASPADQQARIDAASWKSTQISIDVFRLLTRFFGRNNRAELVGLLLILVTGFVLVRSRRSRRSAR